MSTIENVVLSSVKRPEDEAENHVLSPEDWGLFKPYRAHKVARARLKGNAQHIAMMLAFMTPPSGIIEIAHKELCAITGRGKEAVPLAIEECVKAGLFSIRRTRDGFRYTWLKVAYITTPSDEVGQRAKNSRSREGSTLRDAVQQVLRGRYLAHLALKPHNIPCDHPDTQALLPITENQESRILDVLEYYANWLVANHFASDEPHLDAINQAFTAWFKTKGTMRPGETKGYLERWRHPLKCFADDVGRITIKLAEELASKREQIAKYNAKHAPTAPMVPDSKQIAANYRAVLEKLDRVGKVGATRSAA